MKKLIFNSLTFVIILNTISFSQKENSERGKIIFKTNFVNNYILHMYCLAGIGEYKLNTEYYERYHSYIDTNDLSILKKFESRLFFGDGKAGEFAFFCFFLPSYLELSNKKEFVEYYRILIKALELNNFNEFLQKFKIDTEDFILSNIKFFLNLPDSLHKKLIKPLNEEFKTVAEVFIRNIDSYEKYIWPHQRKEIQEKISHWNKVFKDNNLIQRWENFTGLKFSKDYQIFLCYPNKKGPSANSMSVDKNMFYYNFHEDFFFDFVSHEIGTHLLFPLVWTNDEIKKYIQYNASKVYKAVESLCQFYNKKILNKEKLSYNWYDYNADDYEKIFSKYFSKEISQQKINMHIYLLIKGLEEVQ
ncbi:MAG: hypothetical protein QHH13_04435 [Melioribacter sp.]|uniref:hypothetical protein n=1 Tax=Rosettibacter primus TaxID=3111523 RepID=UPI00247BFC3B|nr:hypothetical protein [Melioribacter sp.]